MPHSKDPEAKRAYMIAWRAANQDKVHGYERKRRLTNPEAKRAYMIAWRAANHERLLGYGRKRRLTNPEKVRKHAANTYAKHRKNVLDQCKKYYEKNRATVLARVAAYRHANKSKIRIGKRRYSVTSHARRRARKLSAPRNDLTTKQWQTIKEHYHHSCVYCGKKPKRLTQDHITPLSKGGSHTLHNVIPACQSCNSRKHTGPPLKPVQPLLL